MLAIPFCEPPDMTTAEMAEPTTLPPSAAPTPFPAAPRLRGLRILLIIVAVIEAFGGLSSAPILFGDISEIPGPGIGGAMVKLHLAVHPVLALAASSLPRSAVSGTRSWHSAPSCS